MAKGKLPPNPDSAPKRKSNGSGSGQIFWIILGVCSPLPTILFFAVNQATKEKPFQDPAIKFLLGDWYFSGPMITISLVAIALVVWRMLLNANAKTDLDAFLPVFQEKLQKDVETALRFCRNETGLIPRKLFVAGLEASKLGASAMKRSMASVLELEILPELNFLLAPILAIAKIATMVGLLGTVISMISTFNAISNAKGGNPSEVTAQAGAIGLALFATALGLLTAIPLVFTHVLFKDWIQRFETRMKSSAQRLILLFQTIKPKQGEPKREGKDKDKDRPAETAKSRER